MKELKKSDVVIIAVIIMLLSVAISLWGKFKMPADVEFTHSGKIIDTLEDENGNVYAALVDINRTENINQNQGRLVIVYPVVDTEIIESSGKTHLHKLIGREVMILGEEKLLEDGDLCIVARVIFAAR